MSVRGQQDSRPVGLPGALQKRREWTRGGGCRLPERQLLDHPAFRHTELSYEARGLFGELVLLPEGQVFSPESLAEGTPDSAATIRAALDELAAAGYLAEVIR
ncbi:hypothetical protein ACIA8E_38155 [Streptomyces sp. NPDC051664]|uniref:hypothetical protein n=1 Tax=Streptomyces sp. NPDC051664 TaxID=3365668 RepID=UPI0037AFA2A3